MPSCPQCNSMQPDGAKFCNECGGTLASVCPACGAQLTAGSKFCNGCGSQTGARAASPPPPEIPSGQPVPPQGTPYGGFSMAGSPAPAAGTPPVTGPPGQQPGAEGWSPGIKDYVSPDPGSPVTPPPVTPSRYAALDLVQQGDMLGQFRIERKLGVGGFGTAYLALDTQIEDWCALKVVPAWGQAQLAIKQLAQEWKLRQQLHDYTHILRADRPMAEDHKGMDIVLLPMEYADRGSLRDWMIAEDESEFEQVEAVREELLQ